MGSGGRTCQGWESNGMGVGEGILRRREGGCVGGGGGGCVRERWSG